MYHRLSEKPHDAVEGDYVISPAAFGQQMAHLAAQGRHVADVRALLGGPCPRLSVVLTFDDGCDTDFTVALPILRKARFPAAFFVNPAHLDRAGYLSWRQLGQLAEAGMLVGSHGLDHQLLDGLGPAELAEQLGGSKRALERGLGTTIDTLSLPGGSGGARAIQAARDAGYRIILGSRPGLVHPPSLPAVLPRFALRRSRGIEEFQALVEQRWSVRAAQVVRYGLTRAVRTALGARRYESLRAGLLKTPKAAARESTGESGQ